MPDQSQARPRTAFFDDFDPFYERWTSTPEAERAALVPDATTMAERLIAETDATGQGREYALIDALTHLTTCSEVGNDEDVLDAADVLVSRMNALVNA